MRFGLTIALALACGGCKDKSPPAAPADAGVVSAPTPSVVKSVEPPPPPDPRGFVVTAIAVSSRSDEEAARPGALGDGRADTSWTSKSGDLEGAWVEIELKSVGSDPKIQGIALTPGAPPRVKDGSTKDDDDDDDKPKAGPDSSPDAPRIAELSVSWTPTAGARTTLVESAKVDTESRGPHVVGFPKINADGVLRLTVKKVKLGRAPIRTLSIAEIALVKGEGRAPLKPKDAYVGSLDPKPRGVLDIVPDKTAPLRCLAVLPSVPRVYCVLGYAAHHNAARLNGGELVTIDKGGVKTIAALVEGESFDPQLPYGAWLRAERELKSGGKSLGDETDVLAIPWGSSIDMSGATIRQRETMREPADAGDRFDLINGVLEVQWPGATAFTSIFKEAPNLAPSERMKATARKLSPTLWLLERRMRHESAGASARGAEASICDLTAKKCTAYFSPTPESKDD